MEGELRKLLQQIKEAGGTASLTIFVREGKTRANLEVDLDSEPAPSSSTPASAPRPRRRRRRRARGALQQGAPSRSPPTVPEGEAGRSPRPPRRPLKHLPPAPDGRQAVLTVGRRAFPSFASLNMDGSPPSLPPGAPPPPHPPAVQTFPNLKLRLWKSGRLNTFAHNFRDRIYTLSVMVGVERYRWEHCSSRPVGVPPWHSSS